MFNDSSFERHLGDFDLNIIQASDETIYGMWPDFTLAYVNRGWTHFAAQNDGERAIAADWSPGRNVLDAIAEPLRPFLAMNYVKCLRGGRPWEHSYECSSAKLYRKFHMMTFPLGDAEGLLVINSLRQETPHTRTPFAPLEELYRNKHGVVVQCCHCRRVRSCDNEQTWDWVPEWVTSQPSGTSHGLCKPCIGFHYSAKRISATDFVQSFHTSH